MDLHAQNKTVYVYDESSKQCYIANIMGDKLLLNFGAKFQR